MALTHPRLILRRQQLEGIWSARADGRWEILERKIDELLLQDQPQSHPTIIVLKERLRQRAARRGERGVEA